MAWQHCLPPRRYAWLVSLKLTSIPQYIGASALAKFAAG